MCCHSLKIYHVPGLKWSLVATRPKPHEVQETLVNRLGNLTLSGYNLRPICVVF